MHHTTKTHGAQRVFATSASLMYRLILESLLGLRLEVDKLRFAPCLPADWQEFKVHYRYRETVYHIAVLQTVTSHARMTVTVDGMEQDDHAIPLVDNRQEHRAEVRIHVAPSQRPATLEHQAALA